MTGYADLVSRAFCRRDHRAQVTGRPVFVTARGPSGRQKGAIGPYGSALYSFCSVLEDQIAVSVSVELQNVVCEAH